MDRNERTDEILRLIPVLRRISRPRALEGMPRQGLSMAQIQVMMHLAQHGSVPMGDLATGIGTSFSALTELVDRLEERGMVERVRSTRDRRQIMVQLTPHRAALAAQVLDERRGVIDQVLGALTEAEEEAFVKGLQLLVRALIERGGGQVAEIDPDIAATTEARN